MMIETCEQCKEEIKDSQPSTGCDICEGYLHTACEMEHLKMHDAEED